MRNRLEAYADRDPAVLVIGAGQSGLAIAARLNQLGVDTLVVEKWARIGDNWRMRYHSLALHNSIEVDHLPYMPFPPTYPKYVPKDQLGDWFEIYARAMEINCWTSTEFTDGKLGRGGEVLDRDPEAAPTAASASCARATSSSPMACRSIPYAPELPGLDNFQGRRAALRRLQQGRARGRARTLSSSARAPAATTSRSTCTAGTSKTTIVQRGSTTVVTIDPGCQAQLRALRGRPAARRLRHHRDRRRRRRC